jgi:hypothetical protein
MNQERLDDRVIANVTVLLGTVIQEIYYIMHYISSKTKKKKSLIGKTKYEVGPVAGTHQVCTLLFN